jgi:hypothetical protein
MHNRTLLFIVLVITSFLIISCYQYIKNDNENSKPDENAISAQGTVEFNNIEGGFFGIIADDGSKYKPVNLPKRFQKDGLKIKFTGKLSSDLMSIHMWGKLIEIIKIDAL